LSCQKKREKKKKKAETMRKRDVNPNFIFPRAASSAKTFDDRFNETSPREESSVPPARPSKGGERRILGRRSAFRTRVRSYSRDAGPTRSRRILILEVRYSRGDRLVLRAGKLESCPGYYGGREELAYRDARACTRPDALRDTRRRLSR